MTTTVTAEERPSVGMTIVLGSISTFASVAIEMYLPALPRIAADLRSFPGGIELTISVFLVALAGGQLIYGPLSDRFGRRKPLLAGMTLFCVASAACALSANIQQLIFFRLLQGLGGCAGPVIVRAVIRDRYPAHRVVTVLASLSVVSQLSPLLAPLVGGWILVAGPWRAILWTQAAFGVLVTFSAFLNVKEPQRAEWDGPPQNLWQSYWSVITNRRVMAYALTAAFGGSVIFVYGALMPAIAHTKFGLSAQQISWTLAAGAGGMMACSQSNRVLLRRFNSDQILQVSNLISIAVAAVLCFDAWTGTFGFWGLIVPIFIILGLRGTTMPNASASTLLAEKRHIGIASALFGAGTFGGAALMTAIAARFVDGTPRPMAGGIMLGLIIAAAALRIAPRGRAAARG